MKKYFKVDIDLKQKDENQIPKEVRDILEDPNNDRYFEYLGAVFQDGEEMPSVVGGTYAVDSVDELNAIIDNLLSDYKKEYFDITINKEECPVKQLIEEEVSSFKDRAVWNYLRRHDDVYGKLRVREYNEIVRNPNDDIFYAALVEDRELRNKINNNI